ARAPREGYRPCLDRLEVDAGVRGPRGVLGAGGTVGGDLGRGGGGLGARSALHGPGRRGTASASEGLAARDPAGWSAIPGALPVLAGRVIARPTGGPAVGVGAEGISGGALEGDQHGTLGVDEAQVE